jgi:DNA mismatch repair protein MutS2
LAHLRAEAGRARQSREQVDHLQQRARELDARTTPLAAPKRRAKTQQVAEEVIEGPVTIGDTVRVRGMDQRGEVVAIASTRGEAEVQLGALKLRVPLDDLERLSRRQARIADAHATTGGTISLPTLHERPTPEMQLDVRGWRVEEVQDAVDQYLNDAYLAGMPSVRILHGKGTGALRQAIRAQLARHPLVKAFESAPNAEGGDGISVVTLAV